MEDNRSRGRKTMEGVPMADHEHTGDDARVDAGQNPGQNTGAVSGSGTPVEVAGGVAKHLLDDGPAPTPGDAPEAPGARGRTIMEDVVVTKIAGIAAREVSGVHALGGGGARFVGAVRERIPGAGVDVQQGVAVEVGQFQAAIDVAIVAEFGVAIHELADAIRENVIVSVERMTGLEVTEVNVTVHDVHLPQDDDEDEDHGGPQPARVL